MTKDPLLLSTAIEAVIKAGDIQMSFIDSGFEVSHKGTIDLVTEADVAVETMFRKMIAERFPDHTILAEEFGEDAATRGASHCWVFDPIDGTNNYAHGLPIFCSSLALEIDGKGEIGAIYDPTRKELFVAERGGGAFLNGRPIHVSNAPTLVESMLVTGFPVRHPHAHSGDSRTVRRICRQGARGAAARICRARPVLRGGRAHGRLLGAGSETVGHRRGHHHRRRGRRAESPTSPESRTRHGALRLLATNGQIHDEMLNITNGFLRSRI